LRNKKKEEKGDDVTAVAFFAGLRCNAAKEEEEGDGSNVAIAIFAALRYNAAPQEEEEGNGNVAFFAMLQRSSTRGNLALQRNIAFFVRL
jgi:hypothetical protein